MNTKALRHSAPVRSAMTAAEPAVPSNRAPASGMTRRLARLKAADMPWLAQDGREAFADAPEISGPAVYTKPRGWR